MTDVAPFAGHSAPPPDPLSVPDEIPAGVMSAVQRDTLRHQIAALSHVASQNLLLVQQGAEELMPGAVKSATIGAIHSSMGVTRNSNAEQPSYPAPVYSKDGKGGGQRWNPTPTQLARLEEMYATGMGTPNGSLRTQITDELAKLGPINEANVYNWFQNKKARMKKKEMDARMGRTGM